MRDIAEAAAVALTTDGHDGQTYDLVGPGLLSGPGVAALWSELLGKPIRYPAEDFDQWEQQMRKNAPGWAAHDLRMMFQGYVERGFASTEAEVEVHVADDRDVEARLEPVSHRGNGEGNPGRVCGLPYGGQEGTKDARVRWTPSTWNRYRERAAALFTYAERNQLVPKGSNPFTKARCKDYVEVQARRSRATRSCRGAGSDLRGH